MQEQNIFASLENFHALCEQRRNSSDFAGLLLLKKRSKRYVKLPSACRYASTSFYEFLSGGGGYNVLWRLASKDAETAANAWQWVERKKKRFNGENPRLLERKGF